MIDKDKPSRSPLTAATVLRRYFLVLRVASAEARWIPIYRDAAAFLWPTPRGLLVHKSSSAAQLLKAATANCLASSRPNDSIVLLAVVAITNMLRPSGPNGSLILVHDLPPRVVSRKRAYRPKAVSHFIQQPAYHRRQFVIQRSPHFFNSLKSGRRLGTSQHFAADQWFIHLATLAANAQLEYPCCRRISPSHRAGPISLAPWLCRAFGRSMIFRRRSPLSSGIQP